MLEKRFYAVPPQAFTANGTANGVVTIAGEACTLFKVKQHVIISASTLPNLTLEVKEIDNQGNVQVGPIPDGKPGVNTSIDARTNISAYTVALGANISANMQKRPAIDWAEAMRAMYDEEPTVAMRSILVDECGDRINATNPLPVAATFDGTVQVGDIRITACDDDPAPGDKHSSVRIAGTNCDNELEVNADGSINVVPLAGASSATPIIANIPIVAANTEYSYTFPTATKQFSLKDRDGNSKIRIAYISGDTATNYRTVEMGSIYGVNSISTAASFTIYFQSNKATRVLEIVSWT